MFKEIKPKIENTKFEAFCNEAGVTLWYRVSPVDGYKLHEITLDENVVDKNSNETGKIKLGFTESYITVGPYYDFELNERQIYTKPLNFEGYAENGIDAEAKAKAYDILMGADT